MSIGRTSNQAIKPSEGCTNERTKDRECAVDKREGYHRKMKVIFESFCILTCRFLRHRRETSAVRTSRTFAPSTLLNLPNQTPDVDEPSCGGPKQLCGLQLCGLRPAHSVSSVCSYEWARRTRQLYRLSWK